MSTLHDWRSKPHWSSNCRPTHSWLRSCYSGVQSTSGADPVRGDPCTWQSPRFCLCFPIAQLFSLSSVLQLPSTARPAYLSTAPHHKTGHRLLPCSVQKLGECTSFIAHDIAKAWPFIPQSSYPLRSFRREDRFQARFYFSQQDWVNSSSVSHIWATLQQISPPTVLCHTA